MQKDCHISSFARRVHFHCKRMCSPKNVLWQGWCCLHLFLLPMLRSYRAQVKVKCFVSRSHLPKSCGKVPRPLAILHTALQTKIVNLWLLYYLSSQLLPSYFVSSPTPTYSFQLIPSFKISSPQTSAVWQHSQDHPQAHHSLSSTLWSHRSSHQTFLTGPSQASQGREALQTCAVAGESIGVGIL